MAAISTPSEPIAYLLAGLPCSGKSTFARRLEATGVVRLSLDDAMTARHGRPGKDYSGSRQPLLERPVLRELEQQLVDFLQQGRSVVFDHGLGQRVERERYKRLVTQAGARWRLIIFDVPMSELLRRLELRNADPLSGLMTGDVFRWMAETSQLPCAEGEEPPPAGSP